MRTPTIFDVARQAKVSFKTVSRVIHHEEPVREETRQRVLRAIADLDYQPDLLARSLRSAKTDVLGLVYDNPNAHYAIALQCGVLATCREAGFGLQIYPCDSSDARLLEELRDFARRSRLSGLVLAPPMSERKDLSQSLMGLGILLVRIISASRDPHAAFPCVFVDDRSAAYSITAHLIQLGHVRVGFLWGGRGHRSSAERYKGYASALEDYGVPLSAELVLEGDYAFDDGFRGARRLFGLAEPPTAIFGSNDEIAAGVLAAACAAGLHVPYDLSIAGFEDSPFAHQSWPQLTTSRQHTELIARRAARLLIGTLRGETIANEGFCPELVVRGSTAPPCIIRQVGSHQMPVADS